MRLKLPIEGALHKNTEMYENANNVRIVISTSVNRASMAPVAHKAKRENIKCEVHS